MLTIANLAAICHDANRRYCLSIGDASQEPWTICANWQRQSAMAGVRWRLDNMESPASAQHDAWLADKLADGWIYGPLKDAQAKTHPCLVPYDQLPDEQRAKDALFVAIVKALAGEMVDLGPNAELTEGG